MDGEVKIRACPKNGQNENVQNLIIVRKLAPNLKNKNCTKLKNRDTTPFFIRALFASREVQYFFNCEIDAASKVFFLDKCLRLSIEIAIKISVNWRQKYT